MGKEKNGALNNALTEREVIQGFGIKEDGQCIWTAAKDIMYVEYLGEITNVYTIHSVVTLNRPLHYVDELLHEYCYQCHGSFMVNIHYVDYFKEDKVVLKDGKEVPVSVRRMVGFVKACEEYAKAEAKLHDSNNL